MQSIPSDIYEAAEIDGASPIQQFWFLSLPFIAGILAILFLLRFIWTFNKFDDIFFLTGGNAGTRTLTVSVYEQAFAISNLGAGAAVAVVNFRTFTIFCFNIHPLLTKGRRMTKFWMHGIFGAAIAGGVWTILWQIFVTMSY